MKLKISILLLFLSIGLFAQTPTPLGSWVSADSMRLKILRLFEQTKHSSGTYPKVYTYDDSLWFWSGSERFNLTSFVVYPETDPDFHAQVRDSAYLVLTDSLISVLESYGFYLSTDSGYIRKMQTDTSNITYAEIGNHYDTSETQTLIADSLNIVRDSINTKLAIRDTATFSSSIQAQTLLSVKDSAFLQWADTTLNLATDYDVSLKADKADSSLWSQTGNVITPKTATKAKIDTIIGSSASGGNMVLQSTSHAAKGLIKFGTSAYDEVNNRLGIGKINPGYKLDIDGNLLLANSAASTYFYLGSVNTYFSDYGSGIDFRTTKTGYSFAFSTNESVTFTGDRDGSGTGEIQFKLNGTATSNIYLKVSTGKITAYSPSSETTPASATGFLLENDNATANRVNNIGFGASGVFQSGMLNTWVDANTNNLSLYNWTGGAISRKLYLKDDTTFLGKDEAVTILGNGNVGIGTTTPTEKLHVNGNALINDNLEVEDTAKVEGELMVRDTTIRELIEKYGGTDLFTETTNNTVNDNDTITSTYYEGKLLPPEDGLLLDYEGIEIGCYPIEENGEFYLGYTTDYQKYIAFKSRSIHIEGDNDTILNVVHIDEEDTVFTIMKDTIYVNTVLNVNGNALIEDNFTVNDSLIIKDATGVDTVLIFDDGDTTRIESDNPIKIGSNSLIVETDGDVNINNNLTVNDTCKITNINSNSTTLNLLDDNVTFYSNLGSSYNDYKFQSSGTSKTFTVSEKSSIGYGYNNFIIGGEEDSLLNENNLLGNNAEYCGFLNSPFSKMYANQYRELQRYFSNISIIGGSNVFVTNDTTKNESEIQYLTTINSINDTISTDTSEYNNTKKVTLINSDASNVFNSEKLVLINTSKYNANDMDSIVVIGTDLIVTANITADSFKYSVPDTLYYSFSPSDFTSEEPDIDDIVISLNSVIYTTASDVYLFAPIHLPHGAEILSVVLYGSASDETWYFDRKTLSNGSSSASIANANINTEDITITAGTEIVDNSLYGYLIRTTSAADNEDAIYGGYIKYIKERP